jgi:hypothetical protein
VLAVILACRSGKPVTSRASFEERFLFDAAEGEKLLRRDRVPVQATPLVTEDADA